MLAVGVVEIMMADRLMYRVVNWSSFVVEYHPRCVSRGMVGVVIEQFFAGVSWKTILLIRPRDGCLRALSHLRYSLLSLQLRCAAKGCLAVASLQFLTLELDATSIVKSITFGKFSRSHACNVKKMRVEGGLEQGSMVVLFEG